MDIMLLEHDLTGEDADKKITLSELKSFIVSTVQTQLTQFIQAIADGTAVAEKAKKDENGNQIDTTYATQSSLSNFITAITNGTETAGKAVADVDGNPIKTTYAKNSGADFTGDVTIAGNLTVQGTSYETHTEQLYTAKDEIITRDGATTALGTNEYTGIKATKYDGTNDGQLVFDNTGTARVGDEGSLEPLATRNEESNMTDGALLEWDATNKRIVSSSKSIAVIDDTVTSATSAYSSQKVESLTSKDSSISKSGTGLLANSVIASNIFGCVCSTSASTATKAVTIEGLTTLVNGIHLKVLFTNANTATTNTMLSVNGGTAVPIKYARAGAYSSNNIKAHTGYWRGASTTSSEVWQAYTILELMYYSGSWLIIGNPVVESYFSSTSSYVVYADGLIEQWKNETSTIGDKKTVTYTFPISFSNKDYFVNIQNINTATFSCYSIYEKYNDSIKIHHQGNNSSMSGLYSARYIGY